jgi:hypothetical protein
VGTDWFRSPGWSTGEREDFETRLKRVRVTSRPQYLRIKALAIEEEVPAAAEELLRRIITDYADHWPEVAFAHERLGDLREKHYWAEAMFIVRTLRRSRTQDMVGRRTVRAQLATPGRSAR